jgi:tRNA G18 (ribose-2'-O)-methylase SpoU
MTDGFFGIALYRPKTHHNYGSLLRTSQVFGAHFISLIGARFQKQSSDTFQAEYSIPVYEHDCFDDFYRSLPRGTMVIGVEQGADAEDLANFQHPLRAVYVLGAEDDGLPKDILKRCHRTLSLRGERSLNLAVAGSIVIYHREGLRG